MSDRYSSQEFVNVTITTATTGQDIFGSISVREFETMCLGFQNFDTAGAVTAFHVQAAFLTDSNASAGSGAPNWVDIATTTLAWPSSVAASAIVITPQINNSYKYIRVLAGTTSTTTNRGLRLWIGGHKHHG